MAKLLTNLSQVYRLIATSNNYKLTKTINIFLASLLGVNYVKNMENPKPNLNFIPSNCVVHDDTHGWGGFAKF